MGGLPNNLQYARSKKVSYDSTFPKQIKLSSNRVGWL